MDNMDDRFKYVNDLSVLLKFTVYTTQAVPQFSPDILTKFKEECSTNSLQINERKTKILRINPPKQDLDCPVPWFPFVSSATVVGVNFSADAHFQVLVQKGNCALRSLISMRRLGFPVNN